MPAKLDRSRAYGEVYGPGDCRYEQDNKEFDGQGRELLKPGARRTVPTVEDTPQEESVTDTQPPLEDGAEATPEVTDDLSDMKMSELRALYTEITGKKIKVGGGMNKAKVAAMIRAERAVWPA